MSAGGEGRLAAAGWLISRCTVTLTDAASGTPIRVVKDIYDVAKFQIPKAGAFRWQSTDVQCLVTPLAGTGNAVVPFTENDNGDTDIFAVPPKGLTVKIIDNKGSNCTLRLFDPKGQELSVVKWTPGTGDVTTLDAIGSPRAYLNDDDCIVRVLAQA